MKLVYHGPFWPGSTALHRLEAFAAVDGLELLAHDVGLALNMRRSLYHRIRWRAGWPSDTEREIERLERFVAAHRPDAILVDNTKVFGPGFLRRLRALGVKALAYYSPDDTMNRLNLKRPLRASLPEWDLFFTTKTFNLDELRGAGAKGPRLIGNAFHPALHRPLDPAEVGEDFERFDLVFVGMCEQARLNSLNALCEAGHSVVVYGGDLGRWPDKLLHPGLVMRPAVYDTEYVRALHHGRIALGFLRKANRDQITTRSLEITGAGRPMLAEKTAEHDAHFIDGEEYAGFSSDDELVAVASRYLKDNPARLELGRRGRLRCLASGYSTEDRAREMVAAMQRVVDAG